jgi:hypothetical protein
VDRSVASVPRPSKRLVWRCSVPAPLVGKPTRSHAGSQLGTQEASHTGWLALLRPRYGFCSRPVSRRLHLIAPGMNQAGCRSDAESWRGRSGLTSDSRRAQCSCSTPTSSGVKM